MTADRGLPIADLRQLPGTLLSSIRNPQSAIRNVLVQIICVFALAASSCATLRVPVTAPEFSADSFLRVAADGITLAAHPLETREAYWDVFDDYLPEVGIVAIWIRIDNMRDQEIDASRARWRLRLPLREAGQLRSDDLLKRYYEGRSIRMYTIEADLQARSRLENLLFRPGRLEPSAGREGFIFFRLDHDARLEWTKGAILVGSGIRPSEDKPLMLELPLFYAHP
jgi:hypothetical protein